MTSYLDLHPIPAGGATGIPEHQDPRPEVSYAGPSMHWLLANHKLAHQIIATHRYTPTGGAILDAEQLAALREYVADPSPAGVREWARERGMWDEQRGEFDREKLREKGSLVGHGIMVGAFDGESLELLRGWFESGVLDGETE